MELRSLQDGEEDRAVEFLRSIFRPSPERAGFLERRQIRWKFFEPGPEWDGSRSYILEEGDAIAAHGCVTPIVVCAPGATVRAAHVIDWAGSPAFPAAGYFLLQELRRLAGAGIGIGGSAITRAMGKKTPKSVQQIYGQMFYSVRPLRPWAALLAERDKNWKSPLRFLRNRALAFRPLAPDRKWHLERVKRFDEDTPGLRDFRPQNFSVCRRSAPFLNYMLRCPAAAFTGYLAIQGGRTRGYALLSLVGRQARVADLALASEDPAEWAAAHAAACREAKRLGALEVVAGASIPLAREALHRNGYREYRDAPITSWDPTGILPVTPPAHLGLIDGDASYLA